LSNDQLVDGEYPIAKVYNDECIAEQNSINVAWSILMKSELKELRECLFIIDGELQRFRQILVNCVLATDRFNAELTTMRSQRWERLFGPDLTMSDISAPFDSENKQNKRCNSVMEHMIQVSSVCHLMEHW
jgi:3'5'-cyclic nucleotide phosphodiesterase